MSSSNAVFNGHRRVPPPVNEPIKTYAPGSPERASLKARLTAMAAETADMPLIIGRKEIRSGDTATSGMPHDHKHVLATHHQPTENNLTRSMYPRARPPPEAPARASQHRAPAILN